MPQCRAVVVGIDRYPHPNALPSCTNDARAVARLLKEHYGCQEIHSLFDTDATPAHVEKELRWLVDGARPEDRLVAYFSGHGFTKLDDEIMKEYLVLVDETGKPALWEDDKLVAITQSLPTPDMLTCIFDCCFSGGMFKWVFDPTDATAEAAQIKVYQPPAEEQQKLFSPELSARIVRASGYRPFGCGTSRVAAALSSRAGTSSAWTAGPVATKALADESEARQPELKGVLISACLETETAAASTSRTNGLSAFTHCLLQALANGTDRAAREIFDETTSRLKDLKFRQTAMFLESTAGRLANRTFITMKEQTMAPAAETVQPAAAAAPDQHVSAQDVEKRLLEALFSTIFREVAARHKAFETDDELEIDASDADDPEAIDKGLRDFVRRAARVAVPIIRTAGPLLLRAGQLTKEASLDESPADGNGSDESMQKFLPLLASVLVPLATQAAGSALRSLTSSPKPQAGRPRVIRHVRPAHKSIGSGNGDEHADREMEKSLETFLTMAIEATRLAQTLASRSATAANH